MLATYLVWRAIHVARTPAKPLHELRTRAWTPGTSTTYYECLTTCKKGNCLERSRDIAVLRKAI